MRKSKFDGSFYTSNKRELAEFIKDSLEKADPGRHAKQSIAYVAPHAGYMYSGKTAAYTYKALLSHPDLDIIDAIAIIGPNHTGNGRPISISMEDWETPLGVSSNDRELSNAISENSEYLWVDEWAHENEHSIEVQLPFLQSTIPRKKLVFICMGDQSLEASEILSKSIIEAAKGLGRKILVIASSDFNHYESEEVAKQKDTKLLAAAKTLDYRDFNRLAYELNDSACGIGPITVAMMVSKRMGAKEGMVLKYSNSGEETGDRSSVVAYSSIAFK